MTKKIFLSVFCFLFSVFSVAFASVDAGVDLHVIEPSYRVIRTEDGRIVVSSVESYAVEGGSIGYCSMISRLNLVHLLRGFDYNSSAIERGNAIDIIESQAQEKSLIEASSMEMFKNVLNARRTQFGETVFDVYRRNTREVLDQDKEAFNSLSTEAQIEYLNQGHRAVVFLGDDNHWYILDPLDGDKSRRPQRVERYFPPHAKKATWYIRVSGFSVDQPLTVDQLPVILPFLSKELQQFFRTNYFFTPQVIASNAGIKSLVY